MGGIVHEAATEGHTHKTTRLPNGAVQVYRILLFHQRTLREPRKKTNSYIIRGENKPCCLMTVDRFASIIINTAEIRWIYAETSRVQQGLMSSQQSEEKRSWEKGENSLALAWLVFCLHSAGGLAVIDWATLRAICLRITRGLRRLGNWHLDKRTPLSPSNSIYLANFIDGDAP